MITKANYFETVEEIGFKNLPKKLQDEHLFVEEATENNTTWEYYLNDKDIQEAINRHFANLQNYIDKKQDQQAKTGNVRTSSDNNKVTEQEARQAARWLIVRDVIRGQTVAQLKAGQMGVSNQDYQASIKGNKIIVDEVKRKKVSFSFPLQSIYNEVLEEHSMQPKPVKDKETVRKEPKSNPNNSQNEASAKELAKKLLKPFVLRGDSLRSFGTGRLSASTDKNYVQVKKDIVNVTAVNGKKVDFIFSLKKLYAEITAEAKGNEKMVEKIDEEVRFIKRYATMHGKEKTDSQILSFINGLQKAILERRIRKGSSYAKEIQYIQDNLVKLYNVMGKSVEIKVNKEVLEKFLSIAGSEKVRLSITYLKRYIGIQGKTITKEKAQRLLDLMKKAVKDRKIVSSDPYAARLNKAYESLEKFVSVAKKNDTLQVHEAVLNGINEALDGCGCNDCGQENELNGIEPEEPITLSNTVMNSMDFAKMEFDSLGFTGKWLELIGDPSEGFTAMVFGKPKMGKSYLCVDFAGYLARNHGNVLYVAKEEKLDATLQKKLNDKNVKHPSLYVSDFLPDNLSAYQFVFLDSVNKLGLTPEDLESLKGNNPGVSFIYIFQTTKEGNFRGANSFQHDVDVVIEVPEKGKAVQFGRFNQGGEMRIFEDDYLMAA